MFAPRTADTLHEAALDALPTPIMVHDSETILYVNRAALQVLRATCPEDVIGMPSWHFTHAQSRESGVERRRLVLDQGVWLSGACVKITACDGCVLETRGDAGRIEFGETVAIAFYVTQVREVDDAASRCGG